MLGGEDRLRPGFEGYVMGSLYILLLSAVSVSSSAAIVDEVDRFVKCYQQFTGELPASNNSKLISIKSGTLSGTQACTDVLKSANLVSGALTSSTKDEGKKILHTFNILHNSFFKHLPIKDDKHRWVYDYNDRSYYLLNALFSTSSNGASNYPMSKIFKDDVTYKAVREAQISSNLYRPGRHTSAGVAVFDGIYSFTRCGSGHNNWQPCASYNYSYQTINQRMFDVAKVSVSSGVQVKTASTGRVTNNDKELAIGGYGIDGNTDHNAVLVTNDWTWGLQEGVMPGTLVGLEPQAAKTLPHIHQRMFNNSDGYYRSYVGPAFGQPYPFRVDDIYDNLGAGILFTPNYQEALGMDTETILTQNGVNQIPRQWSEDLISDFFCRAIPVIRQEDAIPHTVSQVSQLAPFRNSVSCMRCHATIDNLSFIARNYQYSKTSPLHGGQIYINQFHKPTYDDLGSVPTNPDDFFPVRTANGNFRYRDYSGVLHDVPLVSTKNDPKRAFRELAQYI